MEQITFGPFLLDIAANRLLRESTEVELRPQAFQALKALLQNSGRHVEYQRMITQAWDGNLVSKHTVAVTIGEVKKALREYGHWIQYRPKLGYRLDVPASEDLLKKAWHFFNQRSREGFERALDCFQQAAVENPSEVRVFEGLSLCYLLLGTYSMRPPREMYPGFLQAHARAVDLGGLTPELRAHRGHALHLFECRLTEAEAELLQAHQDIPDCPEVCVWLAMLYLTLGRQDDALQVLLQARNSHSLWPTVPATEILLRICRRELGIAVECGRKALELHPHLHLGRFLYACALEHSGRLEEALAQYRLACVLSPDLLWLRAIEARCLAKTGRTAEACAIVEQLERLRSTGYVDAYSMALLREALGQRNEAFRELERACHEGSVMWFLVDADPALDPLRADARFQTLRDKAFPAQLRSRSAVSA